MNKKYTYKPTSSVKYGKGGKNKKKTYRSDGKHYDAQWGWLSEIAAPAIDLFGIASVDAMLGEIYDQGIAQQTDAALTGANLAGQLDALIPAESATIQAKLDEGISLTKPKKSSTEFMEGIKDTIGQQTAGITQDIARTGKMTGIKDVLDSADQAYIQAQEKGAQMDERYQQQLTDIEKFETGQETSLISQLGGQEFDSGMATYDLAGDLTSMSAAAGGDLAASALAGQVELAGQQAAAYSDLVGGAIEAVIGLFDFGWEKGGKVPKIKAEKGAKMEEYEEGAKQDMMPAEEADVTPGEFSHEKNPIDVVQDGEKIGEMTGGEAIMPPKDVAEFEQLISEKDKDGVFNKLKQLFAKWDQKAREHKEKNLDQDAMGGAKMGYKPKTTLKYN
jgi:hypothetical protein